MDAKFVKSGSLVHACLSMALGVSLASCGKNDTQSELEADLNVAHFVTADGHLDPAYETQLRASNAANTKFGPLLDSINALVGTPYSSMKCNQFVAKTYKESGIVTADYPEFNTSEMATSAAVLSYFTRDAVGGSSTTPTTADLLGWGPNDASSNGHVVIIIDPDNCIIAHSSSSHWNGSAGVASAITGVAYNQIRAPRCSVGAWKQLETNANNSSW